MTNFSSLIGQLVITRDDELFSSLIGQLVITRDEHAMTKHAITAV